MGVLRARVGGTWVDIPGGSDEVWISPDAPQVGAGYDLWVDTDADAVSPLPVVTANAGNALGVVAVGSMRNAVSVSVANATDVSITNPLTFTTTVGRRYRVVVQARGMNTSAAAFMRLWLRINGVNLSAQTLPYGPTSAYGVPHYHWMINGTGVASTYEAFVRMDSGTATVYSEPESSAFYIEDVGPVDRVTPVDPVTETVIPWITLPLAGSWVQYTPAQGYNPPQYRKVHDRVELKGLIMVSGGGAFTGNELIATLPAGYRPLNRHLFSSISNSAGGTSNSIVRLDVSADGTLRYIQTIPGSTADRSFLSIDALSWSVT